MGIYVFSRDVLLEMHRAGRRGTTSAARSSRGARALQGERAPVPRLLGRRRHGRVVLRREHHADAAAARRSSSTIRAGRSTRTRASCPAPASATARRGTRSSPKAAISIAAAIERVGRRHPHQRSAGCARSAARCCSAPTSTKPTTARRRAATPAARHRPRRRARSGDRGQERADRRRRAPGQRAGVEHADGDGYFIRDGMIIVPKDGVIQPGTRSSPQS